MLEYNEIRENKVIMYEDEPYLVVSSHVFRKQQRKPVNATKLKNLLTGKVVEISFHVSEKVDEADLQKRDIKFLYENRGEYWFAESNDPGKRFIVPREKIGDPARFLTPNTIATLQTFETDDGEEVTIAVTLPIKMEFTVKEAPPSIKGNTATGGTKVVILENGATINAPLFVETGQRIRVNTETGEYVERV
jgi:elongation factor P